MQRESYVHGNSGAPLIGKTIGALLDEVSAIDGSREALVVAHQKIRWTYSELKARSDAFASGLLALGLKPGDRVGIWAPNCAEWTVAQFATAKAGLILVNVNPAYRLNELEHALRTVGCRALITAARFKTSDYIAMIRELVPELKDGSSELMSSRLPELRYVISIAGKHDGCIAFDWILERGKQVGSGRLDAVSARVQIDDAVNIQFTSGTTGLPKGATLSHHNLINNAFFVGEATGIEPGSRVCIPVPLYHCFGMVMGNLGCVTHAATMVYPSESFDPLRTLEAVEAERCDILYGVPTMFIAQLNHPEFSRFDLRSLRRGIMAGAPCPIEVMKEVASKMHMGEITIAYGMTETSPVSFQRAAGRIRSSCASLRSAGYSHISKSRSWIGRARSFRAVKPGSFAQEATRSCWATGTMRHERKTLSIRPAGCIRATWRRSMTMDIAASSVGSRTWSSAAARISIRVKLRSICISIQISRTSRCSAFRTRNTAKSSVRGSLQRLGPPSMRRPFASFARIASRTTRSLATSGSSRASRPL
jgi:acyl-CoA synthetase (AMP-forming)/AMP-acid ligase II